MAIVVDTCSLVMIAKNYLPLDEEGNMISFINESFTNSELILLDTIRDEASFTSGGIALNSMPFLEDQKIIVKTTDLLPPAPKRFDNRIDNNFCVRLLKNELTEEEYIQQKGEFLKSGYGKIIVYSCKMQHDQPTLFENFSVMTEETRNQNDGKLFMKLPLMCDSLNIKTISAVEFLNQNGFKINR